ncbi:PREDICTED: F-box/LRR-repeat protein At3g58980-like [Fragaria vesca subsp. vesca]|uniref:F-box/LRR-repeat protein At3g58980-like n=1 Tax=Fragaria vesca subsp. vesca TaxID=101020 RepID=UPI0002C3404E|nr:PREDICTED: F-box/LRR-repeat protein At3g58980-like [Fragaria vesca subsp. vesca]XP_011470974.1 PREDICTED: F-box/LRR-repeat protein At3g58980-like [Fragaria vesca subsp. vesca]
MSSFISSCVEVVPKFLSMLQILKSLIFMGIFFVSYSLNNVKSLSKVNIDVRPNPAKSIHAVHLHSYLEFVVRSADAGLIHKLFTVVQTVEYLSLSAPIYGDPRTLKEYDLPRSYNLKHLDLLLEACCSWEFLTKLLSLSPNLECLVLECNIKCSLEHSEDHLVHQWCLPDCVPICLLCLKTICIRGFQGRPDEIEMVEYFLKHGEVLSNVTIHDSTICAGSSMRVLSMLPRASKSCQLKFQK